jgi:hypothetical protein
LKVALGRWWNLTPHPIGNFSLCFVFIAHKCPLFLYWIFSVRRTFTLPAGLLQHPATPIDVEGLVFVNDAAHPQVIPNH